MFQHTYNLRLIIFRNTNLLIYSAFHKYYNTAYPMVRPIQTAFALAKKP
jgi:hypothetical protein